MTIKQTKKSFCMILIVANLLLFSTAYGFSNQKGPYTLISEPLYQRRMNSSNLELKKLLQQLNQTRKNTVNREQQLKSDIIAILHQFIDRPYIDRGAEGEGDWVNKTSQGIDSRHIQQDPVYRTDGFNCSTLVYTLLALVNSSDFKAFKRNIVNIEYGTAHLPRNNAIHYCNRNNFTSKDVNRINQQLHFIRDVTQSLPYYQAKDRITTTIDPESWLRQQAINTAALRKTVRTFNGTIGEAMVQRLSNQYVDTYCPRLSREKVTMSYLPKDKLVNKVKRRGRIFYQPNRRNIEKIPTPSIVEIVRNDKYWKLHGKPIVKQLGTGLIVSHVGILTKKSFHQGELIYRFIQCDPSQGKMRCKVIPKHCQQKQCERVMFTHATNAYPDGWYYYQSRGKYYCSPNKPSNLKSFHYCNRVVSIPLGDYLAQYHYGRYLYMTSRSILGLNIQKIL